MKANCYCCILCILCTLFLFGCREQNKEPRAEHVIFIGMDGWGSYSMDKAQMPHLKKMMADGAYTLEKRTVLPSSSAVNWATMFMGSCPELHGYTTWGSQKPELPSKEISHYGIYPSIWGIVRDNYPEAEIGYIYEWDGMQYLAEMEAMSMRKQTNNNQETTKVAVEYIKDKRPNFLGVIFAEPDYVGHGKGHDTDAYYEKLKFLDVCIGEILNAVKEAGIWEETIFIFTSDHGGIGNDHGGKTMEEMETPFVIAGKGIRKGHLIEQSMMQFDVASTIASVFRVEQPTVWIGRSMEEVFVE